jgi:hypothetical protein
VGDEQTELVQEQAREPLHVCGHEQLAHARGALRQLLEHLLARQGLEGGAHVSVGTHKPQKRVTQLLAAREVGVRASVVLGQVQLRVRVVRVGQRDVGGPGAAAESRWRGRRHEASVCLRAVKAAGATVGRGELPSAAWPHRRRVRLVGAQERHWAAA